MNDVTLGQRAYENCIKSMTMDGVAKVPNAWRHLWTIHLGPRSTKRDASVSVDDDYNNDVSNLSKEDFVGVILDVLKMQKNVCLCRHFQVSISPTFYARLFCIQVSRKAVMYLHIRYELSFWRKNIGANVLIKCRRNWPLVKIQTVNHLLRNFFRCFGIMLKQTDVL